MENSFQMSTVHFPLLLLSFLVCHWPQLVWKDKGNLNYLKSSIGGSSSAQHISLVRLRQSSLHDTKLQGSHSRRAGRTSVTFVKPPRRLDCPPVCGRAPAVLQALPGDAAQGCGWGTAAGPGLEPWAGDRCRSLSFPQFCRTRRVLRICFTAASRRGWLLTLVSGCLTEVLVMFS